MCALWNDNIIACKLLSLFTKDCVSKKAYDYAFYAQRRLFNSEKVFIMLDDNLNNHELISPFFLERTALHLVKYLSIHIMSFSLYFIICLFC